MILMCFYLSLVLSKRWFFNVVRDFRCPISDTWWQIEIGGFMIAPFQVHGHRSLVPLHLHFFGVQLMRRVMIWKVGAVDIYALKALGLGHSKLFTETTKDMKLHTSKRSLAIILVVMDVVGTRMGTTGSLGELMMLSMSELVFTIQRNHIKLVNQLSYKK